MSEMLQPATDSRVVSPIELPPTRGMSWFSAFRTDVARYVRYSGRSPWFEVLIQQGLWALLQYRVTHAIYVSRLPSCIRWPLLGASLTWHKLVEVVAGISLPFGAQIGPGTYIGHFGGIVISPGAVIGSNCNIAHGVTIGVSCRYGDHGAPVIGNRVWIGAHAVVAGRITIGNEAAIGANSLVTASVPEHVTVVGVPAQVVSGRGSEGLID